MSEDDSDTYSCIICMDILFYPVVLVCGHRFCKHCFQENARVNSFNCPCCRHRFSNWLRNVTKKNLNIVDECLWEKIQQKFPHDVSRIRREKSGEEVAVPNATTTFAEIQNSKVPKPRLSSQGEVREWYEEMVREETEEKKRKEEKEMKMNEDFIIKLLLEEEQKDQEEREKQLKIDEALARSLTEEEQKLVASVGNCSSLVVSSSSSSLQPGFTDCSNSDTPSDPDWQLRLAGDEPICLGPAPRKPLNITLSSTSSEDNKRCSTPLPPSAYQPRPIQAAINISPIRMLDMPSTSSDVRFGRFSPVPSDISSSNEANRSGGSQPTPSSFQDPVPSSTKAVRSSHFVPVHPTSSKGPVTTTITLSTEATSSDFVPVQSNPSTSNIRESIRGESLSESRCSSGGDSITQELHHFKPIRTSPTTRPKDGSSNILPYMVVAQKASSNLNLSDDEIPLARLVQGNDRMEVDNQVVFQQSLIERDIEEKKKIRQQQIEEDARLARELEKAELEEIQKRNALNKTKKDYNLRKRAHKKNLRKKVLIDRAQATLDNMLVKY